MKSIDGQKLIRSTLWMEASSEARILWTTMLFEAEDDGVIYGSPGWLAIRANLHIKEVGAAIREIFNLADREGLEFFKEIKGGWQIMNPSQYK